MPSLKIVLLGDPRDQQRFLSQIVGHLTERELLLGSVVNGEHTSVLSYKQGTAEAQQLTFAKSEVGQSNVELEKADVVLYVTPGSAEAATALADEAVRIDWLNRLKSKAPNAQLYLHFEGTGDTSTEVMLKRKLPAYQTLCFNHYQSHAKFLEFVDAANAQKALREQPQEPIILGASGTNSSAKNKQPNGVSRFLGATLRFVFGAVVGLVVYNPISSVFAALSAVQRDYNRGAAKFAGALFMLLLSPVLGPLKGLIYDGIYLQATRGWKQGFKSSFRPFYEIPREANLSIFNSGDFNNEIIPRGTPMSRRNIIAGIVIVSLVIAAGLAVWLPAVNAALAISAHAAQYGLGSLSLTQLAFAASGAALVAGTILYGAGVGVVKLGKVIANAFSANKQAGHRKLDTTDEQPGKISKFFGAVFGAVYGTLAALVVFNPITAFLKGCRSFWRETVQGKFKDKSNNTLPNRFLISPLINLTSIVWLPVIGVAFLGFTAQALRGWKRGLKTTLGFDERASAGGKIAKFVGTENDTFIQRRDLIAGLVITGLVVAAGLAFVIPPVSIFLGIPALLTTYGLAGMATWSLALLAAGATFLATTALYGIVSNTYDIWANRKVSASSSAATRAEDAEVAQKSSSARAVEMMGRSPTVGSSVSQNAGPGWFTRNVSTPVSDWWYSKGKAADTTDRKPLLGDDEEVELVSDTSLRNG